MKTLALLPAALSPCADKLRHGLRLLMFAVLATIAVAAAPGAAQTPPEELVRATSQEVLTLIKQGNDRQKLLQLAQEKVVPHFDFARMTQLAVGKSWQQASAEQRDQLTREFRDLLVRTYVNALSAGANVTLKYLPTRPASGDEATVRTQALQPGRPPIAIDYRMEKLAGGEWKVFDVTVDNVSLVTNYRDTFNTKIASSGIDGLIRMLAEKNQSAPK